MIFNQVIPNHLKDNSHFVNNINGYHKPVNQKYYQQYQPPYQYVAYQPVQYQYVQPFQQVRPVYQYPVRQVKQQVQYLQYQQPVVYQKLQYQQPVQQLQRLQVVQKPVHYQYQPAKQVEYVDKYHDNQKYGMDKKKVPYSLESYEPEDQKEYPQQQLINNKLPSNYVNHGYNNGIYY